MMEIMDDTATEAVIMKPDVPKQSKGKKRKHEGKNDHFSQAYQDVQFECRVPEALDISIPGVDHAVRTTRPGSPSRQFKHSFNSSFKIPSSNKTVGPSASKQILHQHANGLCVVTAGSQVPDNVEKIEFLVSASVPCSAGERRKRQSKMLRKGQASSNKTDTETVSDGIVSPGTVLANLYLKNEDGSANFDGPIPLYAFCWGTVLEVNTNVTPDLLKNDPLLSGYLAVILPTGTFPPKECITGTTLTDEYTKYEI